MAPHQVSTAIASLLAQLAVAAPDPAARETVLAAALDAVDAAAPARRANGLKAPPRPRPAAPPPRRPAAPPPRRPAAPPAP